MTEKEWMEDVKKRLEQEKSFLENNILFSTGNRKTEGRFFVWQCPSK